MKRQNMLKAIIAPTDSNALIRRGESIMALLTSSLPALRKQTNEVARDIAELRGELRKLQRDDPTIADALAKHGYGGYRQ